MSQDLIVVLYQGNYARQTGATQSSLDPKHFFFFFFLLQEPRARNVNWLFRGMSILVPKFHLISSLSGTSAAGASQDDLRHAGTALTLGWAGLTTPLTWLAQPYVPPPPAAGPPATATCGFCRKGGCSCLLSSHPNQRTPSQRRHMSDEPLLLIMNRL